jgi:hypothetical protein
LKKTFHKLTQHIFFGNYFVALCAVALSIEAQVQQNLKPNTYLYYILVFSLTVLYYSKAYLLTDSNPNPQNPRSIWYGKNKSVIKISMSFLFTLTLINTLYILIRHFSSILFLETKIWLLIAAFPVFSVLYYGVSFLDKTGVSLRRYGWLKPFVISIVWSGVVTIYPTIFYAISHDIKFQIENTTMLLFCKNFLFISVLCIMFDIKDYAMDYNYQLKTFAVSFGLKKTIECVILPLCLASLGIYILFSTTFQLHPFRIVFNTFPYIATVIVAIRLYRRKNIFYYLIIIDGLMLFKACCGILGSLLLI